MHYVYILKSLKDNKLYIGKTDNLERRIEKHTNGEVLATKGMRHLTTKRIVKKKNYF